jgi:hypothetical protein
MAVKIRAVLCAVKQIFTNVSEGNIASIISYETLVTRRMHDVTADRTTVHVTNFSISLSVASQVPRPPKQHKAFLSFMVWVT